MPISLLADRAIVAVSGEDAEALLNRLVTNSLLGLEAGEARYAALLTPQGKIAYDFLVCRDGNGFWLDCPRDQAADLARRLTQFRLRAKVEIAVVADLAVAASFDGALAEAPGPCFRDARQDGLGWRIVAPREDLDVARDTAAAYREHRIALGVPEGGTDWPYGDTFVHDANLDLLHGVDFGKGCYVGQEVVSRVHHRGTARKRIARIRFSGDPAAVGAELVAGEARIGAVTSIAGRIGLASVRVDRFIEAGGAAAPVTAGDAPVEVILPAAPVGTA